MKIKKLSLSLFAFLVCTITFGADADSLKIYLKKAEGVNRADALLQLAIKLKSDKLDTSFVLLQEAKDLVSSDEYIARAMIVEGRLLIAKGEIAGVDKLKEALNFSNENGLTEAEIKASYQLLDFYYKSAQYPIAIEQGEHTLSLCRTAGDKETEAKTNLSIGITYYYIGDLDKSIKHFEKSLALHTKLGNRNAAAGVSMNIGVITFRSGRLDESLKYYDKAYKDFKEMKDTAKMGMALENISLTLDNQGKLDSAINVIELALSYYVKMDSKKNIAATYDNLAGMLDKKGDLKGALKLQLKSLKIREEIEDKQGIASSHISMYYFYEKLGRSKEQLNSAKTALELFEEMGSKRGVAQIYSMYANYYSNEKDYEKSFIYINKSIAIREEMGDRVGLGSCYLTLGNTYKSTKDFDNALKYYLMALSIKEETGETRVIAGLYSNIGVIYFDRENYSKALEYYKKALELRKEIGIKQDLIETYQTMANLNYKLKKYKPAFDYLVLYADGSKELLNESITEQLSEMEAKYENDKKEKEIALLQKEKEIEASLHESENKRNKLVIGASIGFALLLIFVAIVLFRRNAEKKKTNQLLSDKNAEILQQKAEVEEQKLIIEEKNNEITDSIQYAKRIQTAILPPDKLVKEYLNESFVLYKPKDIVAGDFYWMETVGKKILFAAADCTGHGVPGAMVSVVCNNGLNRSVREFGLTEPGKILDKTRELVLKEFEKSEEEVKDGMDIALCSLDGKNLSYAGAHNPLWIIRNGTDEIEEIKADKQPIGQFLEPIPYQTHKIELNEGDIIYIFSDGYADQFGGEKGKKLKSANFKKLLLSIKDKPMSEQKGAID